MIGMIMAGASVLGGVSSLISGRKERKWGRRNAAAAQTLADERLAMQDQAIEGLTNERANMERMRQEDVARYNDLGYDQVAQNLATQVQDGMDVDGIAETAGNEFSNQYDTAMDAERRRMIAQGVRPGSAAMSRLGENSAFNRARGTAQATNTARRAADDQAFARNIAYTQQGAQSRNSILNQGANMAASYRSEYGMQGEIRAQHLGVRNEQMGRARAGTAAMAAGAAQVSSGALGMAGAGAFGSRARQQANEYVQNGQGS